MEKGKQGERSEPGARQGKRSSQGSKSGRGQDRSGGYLERSPACVGPDLPLIAIEKHFLNFIESPVWGTGYEHRFWTRIWVQILPPTCRRHAPVGKFLTPLDLRVFICNSERTILNPGGAKELAYVTSVAEPRAVCDSCVGSLPLGGLPNRPGRAHGEAGRSPSGPGEIPCARAALHSSPSVSTCRGSSALWAVGPPAPGALRLSTGAWVLHPSSTSMVCVTWGKSLPGYLSLLTRKMGMVTTAMHLGCLEERTQLMLNKHL